MIKNNYNHTSHSKTHHESLTLLQHRGQVHLANAGETFYSTKMFDCGAPMYFLKFLIFFGFKFIYLLYIFDILMY